MLRAVIFDMDGVIVDSMYLHHSAAEEVLNEAGASVTKEGLKKFDTTRSLDAFRKILKGKSEAEVSGLVDRKYARLFERTRGIKPIRGFPEFFSKVAGKYPVAVVSSSTAGFVKHILKELGILGKFSTVIGAEDVKSGKPDPEGYLKAAKALKANPADCLVVEDSIYGVMAAKRAGMKVIAVTNTYERNFLLDADLAVDSLAELDVKNLEALFRA